MKLQKYPLSDIITGIIGLNLPSALKSSLAEGNPDPIDNETIKEFVVAGHGDLHSVLTLIFSDTENGAQIDLIHAATPDQFPNKWEEKYWTPIREYLGQ